MYHKVDDEIGGRKLTLESGEMAKQADGAVVVTYGDTVIIAAAVSGGIREGIDFFPLTVDYREKFYAGGKIPGGFFKREGRPTEKETLTSRLIDRPLRPLFPPGFKEDTEVISMALSADIANDPDILALIGSSAALTVSDIPFLGPVGAVRMGRVGGKLILNPTVAELQDSELNIVLAGKEDSIVMVEGGGEEMPEEVLLEAFEEGHKAIQTIVRMQQTLQQALGRPKREFDSPEQDPELAERLKAHVGERMAETILIKEKQERKTRMGTLRQEVLDSLGGDSEGLTKKLKGLFKDLESQELRRLIIEQGVRADGRGLKDIRSITGRVSALPRTHGSALFTRGETQALVTVTLGTSQDEQRLDNLETRDFHKTFMLHYNFPPFCTGEVKPIRGPGRREIGHGALAERALRPVLPPHDQFPYTIRIVSEILESNGSSSMATVCGGSLALMDAGAPIRSAVAGIAMGLIQEEGRAFILTDILGQEDHLGDMDFKVAGTRKGVTGIQMDIKVQGGLTLEVMREALAQAHEARLFVLDRMDEVLTEPRANLSAYAPRILTVRVPPARVRDVIGPGGKVVRGIVERTGVSIDIEDDGSITIASVDESAAQAAVAIIQDLTQEAEIGKIYHGTVKKIMDFGAFVEIFPGTDGLVHISQLAPGRVNKVTDVLNEGDEVDVKVLDVDRQGKIRLSRKDALSAEDRLAKS